jgi:toxin FitB
MRFILDTNVISELMQPDLHVDVADWFAKHTGDEFTTTAINHAEIFAGIVLLPLGKRKQSLLVRAQALFENDFANQVYPFNSAAALEYAAIKAARVKLGLPISFQDACIAAIAKVHGASVVTRDTGGFAQTGIQVVNPWLES